MNTRMIQTCDIEYDPKYPRPVADAMDLFAYIHSEMRIPAAIQPLVVRIDPGRSKYLVIEDCSTGQRQNLLLEAARKLGLSSVPCRVIDDDAPPIAEGVPPSLPTASTHSSDSQTPWIGSAGLDATHF